MADELADGVSVGLAVGVIVMKGLAVDDRVCSRVPVCRNENDCD